MPRKLIRDFFEIPPEQPTAVKPDAPWLHKAFEVRPCQCGEQVTWKWDYKHCCWTTTHSCRWQQPVGPHPGA